MGLERERWLGPGEAAARLGVTVKALRVYERMGLVTPARTSGRWRAYGADQIARIHRIVVMRDLGLPLKAIADLLEGEAPDLEPLLTAQQAALEEKRRKITDAIALLSCARLKLVQGRPLSLDDLTQLSRETVVDTFKLNPEVKERLEAFLKNRLEPGKLEAIRAGVLKEMEAAGIAKTELGAEAMILMAQMKKIMAAGDPDSEAAQAAVLRWRAVSKAITRPGPEVRKAWMQGLDEAMADPELAPELPFDPALIGFIREVAARMKARGDLA